MRRTGAACGLPRRTWEASAAAVAPRAPGLLHSLHALEAGGAPDLSEAQLPPLAVAFRASAAACLRAGRPELAAALTERLEHLREPCACAARRLRSMLRLPEDRP